MDYFWYDNMKQKYDEKTLCYMDTDSLRRNQRYLRQHCK